MAFLLLPLWPALPASADSAPLVPAARGLKPLTDTAVRMAEERVDIQVVPSGETRAPYKALVSACFWFEADRSEALKVGFPLSWFPTKSAGPSDLLRDFAVEVEGRAVAWTQATVEGGTWAVWDQSFVAGRRSLTQVTYTILVEMGRWPRLEVQYLLETGVHWKGPIGRAEIKVTFPFAVLAAHVESSLPVQVAGDAVTWRAESFEPKENFWVRVVCSDRLEALAADFTRAERGDAEALGRCLDQLSVCEKYLRPDAAPVLLDKVVQLGLGTGTSAGSLFVSEVERRLNQGESPPESWIGHYLTEATEKLARDPQAHRAVSLLRSCLTLGRAGLDREPLSQGVDGAAAAALVALCGKDRLEVQVTAAAEQKWWRPWASGVKAGCGPEQVTLDAARAFLKGVVERSPDIQESLHQPEASQEAVKALADRAAPRALARVPVRLVWSYGRYGPPQRTNGVVFKELGCVRFLAQGPEPWEFSAECRRAHTGFWAGVGAGLAALAAGLAVSWARRRRRRGRAAPGGEPL